MNRSRWNRALGIASAVLATSLAAGQQARADAPKRGAEAPAAADDKSNEAATHFKRGLQLFDEGDYTLALVEFERAYQLAPNYRALYNIALVDMQLSRYANAARTLEAYLHDGGDAIPPARRAEAMKALGELKLRTATVDLKLNVASAEVTLDGRPVDPALLRGPLLIDAGEHTLRASAPGFTPKDKTVTLAGGDRAQVLLELVAVAPAPQQRPVNEAPVAPVMTRSVFWPGFIAAGALAAGSVVSGVLMLDSRARLTSQLNSPASDASERQSVANHANAAAITADILGGLALVTGGVSLYLSLSEHPTRPASVAIGPASVSVSGSF
jgi:hypothetical protein